MTAQGRPVAILRFTTPRVASILLKPTRLQHAKALDLKILNCTQLQVLTMAMPTFQI